MRKKKTQKIIVYLMLFTMLALALLTGVSQFR